MKIQIAASIVALLASLPVSADALTAQQAVERGLARGEVQALFDARRAEADRESQLAGLFDNPEIEYSREGARTPDGRVEDEFWWLRQRINLAGVHGLERQAARQGAQAEQARIDSARRDLAAWIQQRFHEALAAEREAQTVERLADRLDRLVGTVRARVAAGDASRFDLLRLQREAALIHGEALELRARSDGDSHRLFGLIGGPIETLRGDVLPPPTAAAPVQAMLAEHPLLLALDAETEASKLDARAARRRAWPELTLGVGMRELDEIGFSDRDTLLSVGLEIPLFDRGARAARAASASADRYTAERALLAARLEADFDALRQELVSRRQSAAMLRTAIESESLTDVAEQAYDAGELGVLELIDAHRTEVALRRQALQRALEARRTYIELQRMKEGP